MPDADHQPANPPPPAHGLLTPLLKHIPLPTRAVVYYVAFLGFVLILLPSLAHGLAQRFLPWHLEIAWGRALGWVVFGLGFLLYTLSSVTLMRRGRGTYVEFDPPQEFVATGPFRWCRNPIAACLLAMLLGEALAFSSTGIFLLFLLGLPLAVDVGLFLLPVELCQGKVVVKLGLPNLGVHAPCVRPGQVCLGAGEFRLGRVQRGLGGKLSAASGAAAFSTKRAAFHNLTCRGK